MQQVNKLPQIWPGCFYISASFSSQEMYLAIKIKGRINFTRKVNKLLLTYTVVYPHMA